MGRIYIARCSRNSWRHFALDARSREEIAVRYPVWGFGVSFCCLLCLRLCLGARVSALDA